MKTLAAILLLCSSVLADTKTLEVPPGLIEVRLPPMVDAGSVDISWEARKPLTLDYRTYEGNTVVVFYGTSGQAVLVSDVIFWDAKKRDKTTWIVNVRGDNPEPPGPGPEPPAPNPFESLTAVSRDAKRLIRSDGQALIPKIADNFAGVASAVAAGGIRSIEAALTQVKTANRATFGSENPPAWMGWLAAVGAEVDKLQDAGKLADVKAYGQALAAIAEGLR